jgi:hypothetical protein
MTWVEILGLTELVILVFVAQVAGRAAYVHIGEFMPAVRDFRAAQASGNLMEMKIALAKERRAHYRTIDPLWLGRIAVGWFAGWFGK